MSIPHATAKCVKCDFNKEGDPYVVGLEAQLHAKTQREIGHHVRIHLGVQET